MLETLPSIWEVPGSIPRGGEEGEEKESKRKEIGMKEKKIQKIDQS